MVKSSGQGQQSPLLEKQADMNEMFRTVKVTARDKQNQLHDTLKQVSTASVPTELPPNCLHRFVIHLNGNRSVLHTENHSLNSRARGSK